MRRLPPGHYDEDAWAFIAATLALLPRLALQLQLVFARTGESDFTEATLRALTALGDADAPEELLLATDLRLAHVLVDEFQDTSWVHAELLGRLTSGWLPDDGRTLFVVGDPMQSIYRFRAAEVGIFLAAQEQRHINDVPVRVPDAGAQLPLAGAGGGMGQCGVRAGAGADVGPAPRRRRVRAGARDARAPGDAAPAVTLAADDQDEARAVVRHVQEAQREGAQDIAILVRARSHLTAILPALRRADVPYVAVELEPLAERLATRDLLTLTRALTQPADMLAGLALLRAPWCALRLADLLPIAEAARRGAVLAAIADPAVVAQLSTDGAARVARVRDALAPALAARGRLPLTDRVRAAWMALAGPACGEGDLDLDGANRYFAALAAHEHGGDVPDWAGFVEAAGKIFAVPSVPPAGGVQVMTLHRAKGLEFDTVILPGLARPPRQERGSAAALASARTRRRRRHAHAGGAAACARGREAAGRSCVHVPALARRGRRAGGTRPLALRWLHARETPAAPGGGSSINEATDKAPRQWAEPRKGSAWSRLAPPLAAALPPEPPAVEARGRRGTWVGRIVPAESAAPPLLRSPWHGNGRCCRRRSRCSSWKRSSVAVPVYDWAQSTAAAIGTVAHRLLAQVAAEGVAAWTEARVDEQTPRVLVELAAEGVERVRRPAAAARVLEPFAARSPTRAGAGCWRPTIATAAANSRSRAPARRGSST